MPISYTCPHCGLHLEVDDQFAGQSGPCRGCGKMVSIPAGKPVGSAAKPSSSGAVIWVVVGVSLFGLLACGGILAALLLPAIQAAREAARRVECSNNLKQISLALTAYSEVHGSLPPAYIADDQGKPMHSWRVLILPFLEQQALYEQYDFDKPWDSPENQAVVNTPLKVFSCPSSPNQADTNYMVVVGPETMFNGDKPIKFQQILDGTSNTLMVVEVPDSGVGWAEPKDLDSAALLGGKTNHPGGFNGATADCAVRFYPKETPKQDLQELLTPAGQESPEMLELNDF